MSIATGLNEWVLCGSSIWVLYVIIYEYLETFSPHFKCTETIFTMHRRSFRVEIAQKKEIVK